MKDTVAPLEQRSFISDYGAAWIGEGIGLAGLCIGIGIASADEMWALVILWVLCMGPSKSLREPSDTVVTENPNQPTPKNPA